MRIGELGGSAFKVQGGEIATMDIENIPQLVLEALALLIAIVALIAQVVHSRRRLLLDVTYVHVLQVSEDTSVFLLRLSLINNASTGRVVYHIVPTSKVENVTLDTIHYTLDLSHQTAIYQLPKGEEMTLPISELLLPPLDILPHQSLSKWYGMVMKVNPKNVETNQKIEEFPLELRIEVAPQEGKPFASCEKTIYPMRLKSYSTFEPYYPPTKFQLSDLSFMIEPPLVFFLMLFFILLIILSSRAVLY